VSTYTIPASSYSTLPTPVGKGWGVKRSTIWKTLNQESFSGLDSAAGCMLYPRWLWEVNYEMLRSDTTNLELQNMSGFINSCHGGVSPFNYLDSEDFSVTAGTFGTGDGVSTQWQLFRTWGGFYEPVVAPFGGWKIFDNGSEKTATTDFTISNLGIVTFNYTPTTGHALTCTGSFYWLCTFMDDQNEFENFMNDLWDLKKLQFKSKKFYSTGVSA